MSKVIELVRDVWTFGCKGDVLNLADEAIERLDRIAQKTETTLYKDYEEVRADVTGNVIDGEVVGGNEAEAQKSLEADVAAKAKADADQKAADVQAAADKAAEDQAKADEQAAQTAGQGKKNS